MDGAAWKAILARYGQKVVLLREEDVTEVKAFFQPVDEKVPGAVPTALGTAPQGKWLYLGPAEENLETVTELDWEGRAFEVIRHRAVPAGEGILYRWALAVEKDEVTT